MRVLHYSTWQERCGIADFTANIVNHLTPRGVESEVVPVNLNEHAFMPSAELRQHLDAFVRQAKNFDLAHIQHQVGFFSGADMAGASIGNFNYLLKSLESIGKPVVVTFHEEPLHWAMHTEMPDFIGHALGEPPQLQTAPWWKKKRRRRLELEYQEQLRKIPEIVKNWRELISLFRGADQPRHALVHSERTRLGLIRSGLGPECVGVMPLGVEPRNRDRLTVDKAQAKARLGIPENTILLSVFGFIASYKGHDTAVAALRQLPENYRLAIIGGKHPANRNDMTLNKLLEIWDGQDPERLVVTGYVDHETIDRYHAATDICLAPMRPEGALSGSASLSATITSGKPTIASNIPALAEFNEREECVALCTPEAPHELAWHIQRLVGNPEYQQTLVQNAAKYAERLSWPNVVRPLHELYQKLTGSRIPSSVPVGRQAA